MIVAVVALTQMPIIIATQNLHEKFKVISENDMISRLGIGNMVNNANLKYSMLSQMEDQYKNVLIHGNIFLDIDVCNRIISHGGKVIIANETNLTLNPLFKGHYFEQLNMQNMAKIFQNKWNKLNGAIYWDINTEFPTNKFNTKSSTLIKESKSEIPHLSRSIYIKLCNNTMALLVPQSDVSKFSVKVLNGQQWLTLLCKKPDLNSTQLQELKIIS